MKQDLDYVMFTEEELKNRVQELAKSIENDLQGEKPVILCIMKGSLVFTADLMREIDLPCELESITLSSYRAMSTTSGDLTMTQPFDYDFSGKHVLVVEDILDTGKTLSFVMDLLQKQNPASLRLAVLLDKPSRRVVPISADYIGFTIPDAFVVGYGLDYNQQYRNLPCIGVLKPEIYS